ncbi:MAG: hypothetical protein JSS66_08240 [Armatimonadetes bacterium]|nr:hypothetical protein [Armatimonadota bacterium]
MTEEQDPARSIWDDESWPWGMMLQAGLNVGKGVVFLLIMSVLQWSPLAWVLSLGFLIAAAVCEELLRVRRRRKEG